MRERRFVNADALVEWLINKRHALKAAGCPKATTLTIEDIIDRIKKAQIVNVVPVVHGQWVKETDPTSYSVFTCCSICGNAADETDYCPYCGAIMRRERNANNETA